MPQACFVRKDNTWPTREDRKREHKPPAKAGGFFAPVSVHRPLTDGATILGLPGKIGNANTKLQSKDWGFFLAKTCHRHVLYARTILDLPSVFFCKLYDCFSGMLV